MVLILFLLLSFPDHSCIHTPTTMHTFTYLHLSLYTSISLKYPYINSFILKSVYQFSYIYIWSPALNPLLLSHTLTLSQCKPPVSTSLCPLYFKSSYISYSISHLHHPSTPLPSALFQSPSIWASESGRAPDPPMRLGCEGAEPSRPGRGGASTARGGAGLRLPGPPGRAFPPVLHPRSSRRPGGLRGRGLPAAQRAGPEQRCEVQAPVGGTISL